jgi:hypothetical protein
MYYVVYSSIKYKSECPASEGNTVIPSSTNLLLKIIE